MRFIQLRWSSCVALLAMLASSCAGLVVKDDCGCQVGDNGVPACEKEPSLKNLAQEIDHAPPARGHDQHEQS